jgi:hypothetical protein
MRDADIQRSIEELDRMIRYVGHDTAPIQQKMDDMRRLLVAARAELQQTIIRAEMSLARASKQMEKRRDQDQKDRGANRWRRTA